MELSKYKAHRNQKYLSWLREQNCVVSNKKAQCAHHIRLGTNGGTGIKPSDYFCLPLINEYHTTGSLALHMIGEETFLKQFELDPISLFIKYLKDYLASQYDILYSLERTDKKICLAELIEIIESKNVKKPKKKAVSKPKTKIPKIKTEKEIEFYEVAKALKRANDKELRDKLKQEIDPKQSEFYKRSKEALKLKQKEYRDKNKKKVSEFRKKLAKKLKKKAK